MTAHLTPTRRVIDDNGTQYVLSRQLGRGGQGSVYAIEGGKLAVKILEQALPGQPEALRQQLAFVRRLDLRDLDVCRPLETLREPLTGYVMELLDDMEPLSSLANVPGDVESPLDWYGGGGGLRRRLELLARAAATLSALHGKGLVYGDPSPNNVFVSSSPKALDVRLIDADNLRYHSVPAPGLYTPRYGAPELVRQHSGVTTLTDAHAFAIVAFQTLCCTHPLLGDEVLDGEPELEDQALRGELPWIDHPEDDRNRCTHGLPRDLTLSPNLGRLFQRFFQDGLTAPTERPGLSALADALQSAAGATLTCSACKQSYYRNRARCPWCGAERADFLLIYMGTWNPVPGEVVRNPDKTVRTHAHLSATDGEARILNGHHFTGRTDGDANEPWAIVRLAKARKRVLIQNLVPQKRTLWVEMGKRRIALDEAEPHEFALPTPERSYRLHAGQKDEWHGIAAFELRAGTA